MLLLVDPRVLPLAANRPQPARSHLRQVYTTVQHAKHNPGTTTEHLQFVQIVVAQNANPEKELIFESGDFCSI